MSKLRSISEIEMARAAEPNFGKGITVASGFDLGAKAPLDSRATVKTLEERDAHLTGNRAYEGMLVYVEADKKTYQLVDGQWKVFGFDNEQFEANVEDTLESDSQTTALSAKQGKVLKGMIDAQSNQLSTIEGKVDKAIEDIAGLGTDLENGLETVNNRIDSVEAEVSNVDAKVDANTQSITQLDSELKAEIKRAKEQESAIRQEVSEAIANVEGNTDVLEGRLDTAEATIAKNTAAIEKEIKDREAADSALETRLSELDAAYKNADTTINGRLDALEGATADLEQVRNDIAANTSAITKEVQDRTQAVNAVDSKLTAEISRATAAEEALGNRIDGVETSVEEVRNLVDTKTAQTLKDAKAYTDTKISEVNAANSALELRVEANETALGLVDGKISTAKTEAIDTAKSYTNSEISKIDAAYKAADTQVLSDAKSYADTKIGEAKTALESSISTVDKKVDSTKVELQGNIDTLAGRVSVNESDIQNLKDAVSNKNNNTIVVNTEDEIATANANPKVGDMAYVISSKRAYIFKGVNALSVKAVPQGWVVFDEITSELDLVDYLKKDEAEATYRKLADKIAEGDLATELVNKIDAKADKSYVDGELAKKTNEAYVNSKVEEVVAPVRTESAQNKVDIAQEVQNRTTEIARVESVITSKVDAAKQELTSSLTEKEDALKAEDAKLNNKISKFATVVSAVQPVDTEAGHVWLELV